MPRDNKLIAEDNRQVIGVKACNTDLAHFNQMLVEVGDMINVLSGEEYHFFSHILLGARVVLSPVPMLFRNIGWTCSG